MHFCSCCTRIVAKLYFPLLVAKKWAKVLFIYRTIWALNATKVSISNLYCYIAFLHVWYSWIPTLWKVNWHLMGARRCCTEQQGRSNHHDRRWCTAKGGFRTAKLCLRRIQQFCCRRKKLSQRNCWANEGLRQNGASLLWLPATPSSLKIMWTANSAKIEWPSCGPSDFAFQLQP